MFIDCHVSQERRAEVRSDHAERCLGHAIGGVRGLPNRHAFLNGKRTAFDALARIINILDRRP